VQNKTLISITRWCWILLVLLLPVTSQPLVARFARTGSVAPLSGIFLALLFLLWFVPYLWNKGTLPRVVLPILIFVVWAILTTCVSFFHYFPPYKDISLLSSTIKGISTLLIGIIFYLVTSTYIKDTGKLKLTFQMVNWGGLAIIVWSFIQIAVNLVNGDFPHWMDAIQSIFSKGVLVRGRATGFTLEPSWLAHQLNMLYLPFWLAAVASRFTAHTIKIWKFHFEDILLGLGAATLMASFSRVGLLAFLLMVAFLFIRLNIQLVKKLEKRFFGSKIIHTPSLIYGFRIGISITLVILYAGLLFAVVQAFMRFDPRMAGLFQFSQKESDPILRYANSLKFGERLVYWLAAWKIFGNFPWLGVGLGVAGFYFPTSIVAYGWSLVEVKKLFFHTANLLNIKSLWFRLLAETGIIGFSLFFTWLFMVLISAIKLSIQKEAIIKVVGLMGIFVLIGFLIEGFSIDSFAMPYLWFSAGIISAMSVISEPVSRSKIR
jgi:O-Antigen ligase